MTRLERAGGFSDESSSSIISKARAELRFENTHTCSLLVEEANSLLSFSMKVEAIAIRYYLAMIESSLRN